MWYIIIELSTTTRMVNKHINNINFFQDETPFKEICVNLREKKDIFRIINNLAITRSLHQFYFFNLTSIKTGLELSSILLPSSASF